MSATIDPALWEAYQAKPPDYQARTEHVNAEGDPEFINRLILQASPYLLQHAHNPVNWQPWDAQAFAEAKQDNKLIFLSIGYSTCHWCHVMERESFENKDIAAYLNAHYIAIKVDREQRPDIDSLYMTAVTLMNGQGGWPMTVVMTPDGQPFFTATYLRPNGLQRVLKKLQNIWQENPEEAKQLAERVTQAIKADDAAQQKAEQLQANLSSKAVANILKRFDALEGGFSGAPKFPHENYLFLLLDDMLRTPKPQVWQALTTTLNAMAQGGIYDQIGGGFHRYSTDSSWLVPHFEKMLYNQAHMARAYHLAAQLEPNAYFQNIATETLDYTLKEMRHPDGGFFSASDADSEGEEGKFFVWQAAELKHILDAPLADLAIDLYAVTRAGNFELGNILYLPSSLQAYMTEHKLEASVFQQNLALIKQRLYAQRQHKIAPSVDRKIITAWNGMLITTLAMVGRDLQREDYIQAATKAAHFIWQQHRNDTTLWRSSLAGRAEVQARQEDYAYLAQSYLALYDATAEAVWLTRAQTLCEEMLAQFWDETTAGFFMGMAEPGTPMIHRPKDWFDGAQPSGNAVALTVLVALYHRTGEHRFKQKANALLNAAGHSIKALPEAYATTLLAANNLSQGETGWKQYAAQGHVSVSTTTHTKNAEHITLNLTLSHAKGWHTNTNQPLDAALIATQLALNTAHPQHQDWHIDRVVYPAGTQLTVAFSEQPLAVYQGQTSLQITLSRQPSSPPKTQQYPHIIPLQLTLQSCSHKSCLRPEQLNLYPAF